MLSSQRKWFILGAIGIDKVIVTPLLRIQTDGGDVLHGIKNSDSGFIKFGEVYFSLINFNQVKAWKRHLQMTLNLVVPIGQVRFVFNNGEIKNSSEYKVIEIGEDNYARITVPPGIWVGFKGLRNSQNLIMNVASQPHDDTEIQRIPKNDFSFGWNN